MYKILHLIVLNMTPTFFHESTVQVFIFRLNPKLPFYCIYKCYFWWHENI